MQSLPNRSTNALLVVLGLWLSGCGGSSDTTTAGPAASAPITPSGPPASAPSAPTGHTVTGTLPNIGAVVLAVSGGGISRAVTATGNYSIADLPNGTYTLTPSAVNALFDPTTVSVEVRDADVNVPEFKVQVDGLDDQTMAALAGLPDTRLANNAVTLPNGFNLYAWLGLRGIKVDPVTGASGPTRARALALPATEDVETRKLDVIAAMVAHARQLSCGHSSKERCTNWDFGADSADPTNSPAQLGLAYVWGSRTVSSRQSPTDGLCAYQKLFGLDCSGLMHNVAIAGGMATLGNSGSQRLPGNWTIPASWGLAMQVVTDGSYQSGDIAGWNGHIGIVALQESSVPGNATGTAQSMNLISALGRRDTCEANLDAAHGPKEMSLTDFIKSRTEISGKQPVAVLRLVATKKETCEPVCGANESCRRSPSCPAGSTCAGTCIRTDVSLCPDGARCPGGYSCSSNQNNPYPGEPRKLPICSWTGAADTCPNGACSVCPAGWVALGFCFPK